MESVKDIWAFVIALAAVINGLGVVRLISGLGEYLKKRSTLNIQHYWVYSLLVGFQLLAHLLLWWSIIGLKAAGNINFLSYLYLLIGPTLLYLATCLVIPDPKDTVINLRAEYYSFRKVFFSTLTIFFLWSIFIWPVFGQSFAPTVPLIILWLLTSTVLSVTDNHKTHAVLVPANFVIFVVFVAIFAMQLGEVGRDIVK